jgi:hypothetical protein
MKPVQYCLECGLPVSPGMQSFSRHVYGHSLCMRDLYLLEESGVPARVVDLYLALKAKKFPLLLDYFDGFRRVDMAVPDTLYIEVTGTDQYNFQDLLSELMGTDGNFQKNIPTILIPGAMLENPASYEHAVDEISKVCSMMLKIPLLTGIGHLLRQVQLQ